MDVQDVNDNCSVEKEAKSTKPTHSESSAIETSTTKTDIVVTNGIDSPDSVEQTEKSANEADAAVTNGIEDTTCTSAEQNEEKSKDNKFQPTPAAGEGADTAKIEINCSSFDEKHSSGSPSTEQQPEVKAQHNVEDEMHIEQDKDAAKTAEHGAGDAPSSEQKSNAETDALASPCNSPDKEKEPAADEQSPITTVEVHTTSVTVPTESEQKSDDIVSDQIEEKEQAKQPATPETEINVAVKPDANANTDKKSPYQAQASSDQPETSIQPGESKPAESDTVTVEMGNGVAVVPAAEDKKSHYPNTNINAPDVKASPSSRTIPDDIDRSIGPDQIIPSEVHRVYSVTDAVKLHLEDKGPAAKAPISVPTLLKRAATRYPTHSALAHKQSPDQAWTKVSYQQYYDNVRQTARAFIALGLEPSHAVGIMGFNSPEWFYSALGAVFAGGLCAGIYTTNSPEASRYVIENCSAQIVVVEDDKQLQKILEVWPKLPLLKAVVQWKGKPSTEHENVYSWEQLMSKGSKVPESALKERLDNVAVNRCCSLIYTSGTTGNPKGVMLSHDNVTWTARMAGEHFKLRMASEVIVSYLPLSHIAAQMCDIYAPIVFAATTYFAQPDALKGSLVNTLRDVRPTAFIGVPRVWEKIQENMKAVSRQSRPMKQKIARWAKDIGLRGNKNRINGTGSVPWGWTLANALVFRKVRAALGFDRCRIHVTAAAPIMNETLEFFLSLNIEVLDLFGMSESSGPHTCNMPGSNKLHSSGRPIPGMVTLLDKPDETGNGEICMRGRHVMMGYLGAEDKTNETLDSDGLLHSGDIGRVDQDGFLFITGRMKEILITAGGENVAPIPIEENVKNALPCISNATLIGDRKKFLSMLLTMKSRVDSDTGEPLDDLAPDALQWCRDVAHSSATTVKQLLDGDDNVLKAIQSGIDKANAHAPSRAQKIQKWTLLPADYSIPGGELGPTLKMKRPYIYKKYHKTIEAFYEN